MSKEFEDIHQAAIDRMASSESSYSWLTDRMRDEFRFCSLEQWTDEEKVMRAGRPCLVIDKVTKYVDKVSGFFRQNPPGAVVKGKYDSSDIVAKILTGYTRTLLSTSQAKACIQTAGEHLAKVGYGWLYVGFEKDGPRAMDEYVPVLKMVTDPRAVRFDTASVEADGSDGTWCMLLRKLNEVEARRIHGEEVTSMSSLPDHYEDMWANGDEIILADYWWIENEMQTLSLCVDPSTGKTMRLWEDELEARPQMQVVKSVQSERRIVKYALVSGAGVLESYDWPGCDLPLVPAYGRQALIEDRMCYTGMVRAMMDPQRLINYYSSQAAEVTALSPKSPWVIEEGQIEGHEEDYDADALYTVSSVVYKKTEGVPPPSRAQQVNDVSPLLNAIQTATQDLTDVVGIYESSLGQESNQKSGVAIENAAKASDQVLAILIDNLRRAVIRALQVAVNMVPHLVIEERTLRIMTEEGEEHSVKVNTTGPQETEFPGLGTIQEPVDLIDSSYEVVVEAGASYQTRRQEGAQGGIELMNALPDMQRAAIAPAVVRMQDWAGSKQMARVLEASLPPEIRAALAGDENKEEDPQAKAIMDQMRGEIEQSNAELDQKDAQLKQMQDALQQLQMAVLSTRDDNQTKLQIAAMQTQKDLEIAKLKAGVDLDTSESEQSTKLIIEQSKQKQAADDKLLDVALNNAQKILGDPSMGPSGDISGRIRGVTG
jgi:hypothetical protein